MKKTKKATPRKAASKTTAYTLPRKPKKSGSNSSQPNKKTKIA